MAYYWTIWGFQWLAVEKGTEAVGCFYPQDKSWWQWEKKGWARKGQISDKSGRWGKLDMGREWPWCLPVLTSRLPRKCQSEIFRKGCCHGNLNWLFPSWLYGDKCPRVPRLSPCWGEEGSHFEVSDASWKIQSRQGLPRQTQLQRVARIQAQDAEEPVRELIKI